MRAFARRTNNARPPCRPGQATPLCHDHVLSSPSNKYQETLLEVLLRRRSQAAYEMASKALKASPYYTKQPAM